MTEGMKAWAVVGYTYRAEQYCPACLPAALTPTGMNAATASPTEDMLDGLALAAGIDRDDERTFDSGTFPKVIFASQVEDDTCGACGAPLI